MDPQTNDYQGMNPSQPQPGAAANMPLPAQAPPLQTAASPPLQPPAVQPGAQQPGSAQAGPGGSAASSSPAEAADNDVIEKEWVIQAKQIVSDTRHDPFKQVRELNKLKADYMKKRYDKELKLPDA